jgi:hypothetical protein
MVCLAEARVCRASTHTRACSALVRPVEAWSSLHPRRGTHPTPAPALAPAAALPTGSREHPQCKRTQRSRWSTLHPRPSRVRARACAAALVSLHVVCIRGQAGCGGGPALPLWSACMWFASAAKQGAGAGLRCRCGQAVSEVQLMAAAADVSGAAPRRRRGGVWVPAAPHPQPP